MACRYLTEADVDELVDMLSAINAMEEVFRQSAIGKVENVPRMRAHATGVVLHTMSAAAEYLGYVGWKCYTSTRETTRFLVGLYEAKSGQLVALIEADRLGRLRTGATTGVAVQWMAWHQASDLGLFGAGKQAAAQLEAVAAVRKIEVAYVYSRDAAGRNAFAEEMSLRLGIDVRPVDRPAEAASDLPIVVTATTARTPVFDGADLAEGALVCAVGSNWLSKAEVDADTIRRADNIVCDSVKAARYEAGDFVDALEKGVFRWESAVDLSDVVSSRQTGRNNRQSICLFKSVGLAIEDVALATLVYLRAVEQGRGLTLPL